MLRTISTSLFLCLLVVPMQAQEAMQLKSADRKKVAKAVGSWVDAEIARDSSARLDAIDDIQKALGDLGKKLKGKNVFSMINDWKEIFMAERDYPRAKTGKILVETLPIGSDYAVWVPKSYKPSKKSSPCLIVLAGDSATGEAAISGLPEEVKASSIILSPDFQGLTVDQLTTAARARLLFSLALQSQRLRIDRDKVLLLGVGSSAPIAATLASFLPHFFSGVAIVGGGGIPDTLPSNNLDLTQMQEHVDVAAACEWLSGLESRDLAKETLDFSLIHPEFPSAYWVLATKFDTPDSTPEGEVASLKVSVDKGTNTITLESKFVYQVNLLLNDSIVDLSKEVTIIRNGESVKTRYNRGFNTLSENFLQFLYDGGAVFPVSARGIDIPVKP